MAAPFAVDDPLVGLFLRLDTQHAAAARFAIFIFALWNVLQDNYALLLTCSFSLQYNTICQLMICHRLKTKDLEHGSSSNMSLIGMTIFLKSSRLLLARPGLCIGSSLFQLILG
jgi:hypothetical protein